MPNRIKIDHFNFLGIISNVWFLAIIPATIIVLLLPELLVKYQLELKNTSNREESKLLQFYHDMDHDGTNERIDISNFYNRDCACIFWSNNNTLANQFNLYGKVPSQYELTNPIYCDVTGDGCDELFMFTQKHDSIFINAIDYVQKIIILKRRLITTIGFGNGKLDYTINPIINHDYNNDGIPEIYFSVIGGFALYPRKLFAYDFRNDSMLTSIDTGSKISTVPVATNNGLKLIGTSSATDNCRADFPYPYQDTCAWLFQFNDQLNLVEEPVHFPGIGCNIIGPMQYNEELQYFVRNEGVKTRENYVFTTNLKGEFQNRKKLPMFIFGLPFKINQHHKIRYLQFCIFNGLFLNYEYDPNNFVFNENSWSKNMPYSYFQALNKEDKNNTAYAGFNYKKRKFELLLDNAKQIVEFDVNFDNSNYYNYLQTNAIAEGKLILKADAKQLYTYLLIKNPFYPFRYLLFLIVYLFSVGFIYLKQQLQKRQILKRENLQKQIHALQLQLVNSQLDPHFTFNTLNTVSSKILKGEKFEAYDLMTCFSRMMRSAMLFTDKDQWSLEEELKFTTDYLSLMKERFSELFNFNVSVDPKVEITKIFTPRLLIQNFAENAIKHAFTDIDYLGQISIEVSRKNQEIQVEITDNGIGREKAKINFENSKTKSGKGLGLIKQQVEIYNQLYNTSIQFEIKDHSEFQNPGTKVFISIPLVDSLL